MATELEGTLSLNALPAISEKGFPEPVRVFEVDLAKAAPAASAELPPVTSLS
jgi:hypothetical protein